MVSEHQRGSHDWIAAWPSNWVKKFYYDIRFYAQSNSAFQLSTSDQMTHLESWTKMSFDSDRIAFFALWQLQIPFRDGTLYTNERIDQRNARDCILSHIADNVSRARAKVHYISVSGHAIKLKWRSCTLSWDIERCRSHIASFVNVCVLKRAYNVRISGCLYVGFCLFARDAIYVDRTVVARARRDLII